MKLFQLSKGAVVVTSMWAYNKQKDVFVEKFRVLEVETYCHMIKRSMGRIIGYMKHMDFVGLKKMFYIWSRAVKVEYTGDKL